MSNPIKLRCLDDSSENMLIVSTNTRASTNASTGSLVIHKGGLSIDSTENASNSSVGGALTVGGGAAFGQDIKIGGGITVGNINFTGTLYQNSEPYLGSQWTTTAGNVSYTSGNVVISNLETTNFTVGNFFGENFSAGNLVISALNLGVSSVFSGSFSASNNVSTPTNVTGFVFDNTITAFHSNLMVNIDATENLYENFTLSGNKTDNGWNLYVSSIGGSSGVTFTITSGGQLQYTSSNLSGFVSSTFRYSCTQISESGTYTPVTPSTSGTYIYNTLQVSGTQSAVAGSNTGSLLVQGGMTVNRNIIANEISSTNATISQLVSTNVSAGTFVGSSATLSGALNAGTATVPQLVATNVSAGAFVGSTASLSGAVQITNTTNSSTTSTGALVVSGGIGVNGKIHANEAHLGTTVISGDLTVTGSTITLQSETQVINDNLLVLNSGPDGVYDSGIMINLTTGSYATMFYDTATEHFHFAHTSSDPGTASVNVEHYIGLRGQHVDIMGTENASGVGTGGSLTTLGGASIKKDLYVGGALSATNVSSGAFVGSSATLSGALNAGSGTVPQLVATNVSSGTFIGSNATLTTETIGTSLITSNLRAIGNSNTLGSIITTDENVGIGTNSPQHALHVDGTARANSFILNSTSTKGSLYTAGSIYTDSNWGMLFRTPRSGVQADFSFAAFDNTKWMTITSSGNVGIGTSTPQSALQISGTIPVAPTGNGVHMGIDAGTFSVIQLNSTAGSYIDFSTSGTDGLIRLIYNNSNQTLQFSNRVGANLMTLLTTGNVGIGTSSPTYTLDVNGTFDASNSNGLILFASSGNVGIGTTSPTGRLANSNLNPAVDGIGIGRNGLVWTQNEIGYTVAIQNTSSTSSANGVLIIGSATDTSSYPLRVMTNASNQFVIRGDSNIGIGTNSPRAQLEIQPITGSTSGLMLYSNLNDGGINRIIFNHSQNADTYQKTQIQTRAVGANGFFARSDFAICVNTIADTTNATFSDHKFFISGTTGNIGIGTSNPRAKIHATGDLYLTNYSKIWARAETFAHAGLLELQAGYVNSNLVDAETSISKIRIYGYDVNANLSGSIRLNTNGIERMSILQDGKININAAGFGNNFLNFNVTGATNTGNYPYSFMLVGDPTINDDNIALLSVPNSSNSYITGLTMKRRTGNIGIGTHNPGNKLTLFNNTNQVNITSGSLGSNFNADFVIERYHSANVTSPWGLASSSMEFRINNGTAIWSAGAIVGVADPFGGSGLQGGLGFYTNPGGSINTFTDGRNGGGLLAATLLLGRDQRAYFTGNVGIATSNPRNKFHVDFGSDGTGFIQQGASTTAGVPGSILTSMNVDRTIIGPTTWQGGSVKYLNFYARLNSVNYEWVFTTSTTVFTGQHMSYSDILEVSDVEQMFGLIVVTNGEYKTNIDGTPQTGKNGITINNVHAKVELSSKKQQKSVYGVITTHSSDKEYRKSDGSIVYDYEEYEFDRDINGRIRINSLGEGGIWVCNEDGNLENGDFIMTSTIPGYGCKQSSEYLSNYTVAKATCSVDFNDINLDEKFNLRYLEENGTIISKQEYQQKLQNNENVYIAAFIGCTYHCG